MYDPGYDWVKVVVKVACVGCDIFYSNPPGPGGEGRGRLHQQPNHLTGRKEVMPKGE